MAQDWDWSAHDGFNYFRHLKSIKVITKPIDSIILFLDGLHHAYATAECRRPTSGPPRQVKDLIHLLGPVYRALGIRIVNRKHADDLIQLFRRKRCDGEVIHKFIEILWHFDDSRSFMTGPGTGISQVSINVLRSQTLQFNKAVWILSPSPEKWWPVSMFSTSLPESIKVELPRISIQSDAKGHEVDTKRYVAGSRQGLVLSESQNLAATGIDQWILRQCSSLDVPERSWRPSCLQSFQGFVEEENAVEETEITQDRTEEISEHGEAALNTVNTGFSENAANLQPWDASSSDEDCVERSSIQGEEEAVDALLEWLARADDTEEREEPPINILQGDRQPKESKDRFMRRTDHIYNKGETVSVTDDDELAHAKRGMVKQIRRGDFVVVKSTGDLAQIVDPQKRKLAWCHSLQSEWVEDIDWPVELKGRCLVTNHIQVWPDLSKTIRKASKDDPRLPIKGPWLEWTMRTNGEAAGKEGFVLRRLPTNHADRLWIEEEKQKGASRAKRRRCR